MNPLVPKVHEILQLSEQLDSVVESEENLNKIFIKATKSGITFEPKDTRSWFSRLFEPNSSYNVKYNFNTLRNLFEAIKTMSADDLEQALDQLKKTGSHRKVANASAQLLLFKERLNAILMHVAHKKKF